MSIILLKNIVEIAAKMDKTFYHVAMKYTKEKKTKGIGKRELLLGFFQQYENIA